jgi:hypothetical protein
MKPIFPAKPAEKPKIPCKTCGGYWGTTGHRRQCPQRVYTMEGKFCECGNPATTTSAVSSRPDPVCQRCHDIEKGGYTVCASESSHYATYPVRLPRFSLQ